MTGFVLVKDGKLYVEKHQPHVGVGIAYTEWTAKVYDDMDKAIAAAKFIVRPGGVVSVCKVVEWAEVRAKIEVSQAPQTHTEGPYR